MVPKMFEPLKFDFTLFAKVSILICRDGRVKPDVSPQCPSILTDKNRDLTCSLRHETAPEAVLTSTHNICFEQKYEKYQNLLSEKLPFLVVKCSMYTHGKKLSITHSLTKHFLFRFDKQSR